MKLGKTEEQSNNLIGRRDAFHVACALCSFDEDYDGPPKPGMFVRFTGSAFSMVRQARPGESAHGVIDPFLTSITPDEMFWVLLMPNLASAPRHDFDLNIDIEGEMEEGQWDCRDCPD